jgi:hypothetical protein
MSEQDRRFGLNKMNVDDNVDSQGESKLSADHKKQVLTSESVLNFSNQDVAEDDVEFNTAKYLFLSYRLACQYPDMKIAQIIRQFSTPWPRQSYHRVTDMSQEYQSKFAALSRSISMVVMFFLSNLLTVPLAIQDMIVQMATTTVTGYTVLLHIQLYHVYPLLVAIPTIFVALVVHFFVQSNRSQGKVAFAKMLEAAREREQQEVERKHQRKALRKRKLKQQQMDEEKRNETNIIPDPSRLTLLRDEGRLDCTSIVVGEVLESSFDSDSVFLSSDSEVSASASQKVRPDSFEQAMHVPIRRVAVIPNTSVGNRQGAHMNRRESIQQGLNVLHRMNQEISCTNDDIISEIDVPPTFEDIVMVGQEVLMEEDAEDGNDGADHDSLPTSMYSLTSSEENASISD